VIPVALDFGEARRIFDRSEQTRLSWYRLQEAVVESGQGIDWLTWTPVSLGTMANGDTVEFVTTVRIAE